MTLLVTVFAALISTIIWYKNGPEDRLHVGFLCWLFWGASIMWFVDAIFEYAELKADFFTPAPADMLNDLFLGLCVIALAMTIWVVYLLVKDPCGVVRAKLLENKSDKEEKVQAK